MPAILPGEKEGAWLRQGTVGPDTLASLLGPFPASEMEAFPVSGRVNDPANDGPDLIRPLARVEKQVSLPLGD